MDDAGSALQIDFQRSLFSFQGADPEVVGVFNDEGPPVPIPNTEVKLISAENTCLATDREDRSMPTLKEKPPLSRRFFGICASGGIGRLARFRF